MKAELRARLRNGETIYDYREPGNSMAPIIKHREPVTIAPCDVEKIEIGDIVYAKVRGRHYTHRVNAIQGDRIQIANNHGLVNGWTSRRQIYGIVIEVNGRPIPGAVSKVTNVSLESTE